MKPGNIVSFDLRVPTEIGAIGGGCGSNVESPPFASYNCSYGTGTIKEIFKGWANIQVAASWDSHHRPTGKGYPLMVPLSLLSK